MCFGWGLSMSMSKISSFSSSIRWLMLLLLTLRSMLTLPVEPVESVLVGGSGCWEPGPEPEVDRAVSILVRCRPCVSMLMLAWRGGLLMLGLSSPLLGEKAGCEVGKEESRSGEPTWPRPDN